MNSIHISSEEFFIRSSDISGDVSSSTQIDDCLHLLSSTPILSFDDNQNDEIMVDTPSLSSHVSKPTSRRYFTQSFLAPSFDLIGDDVGHLKIILKVTHISLPLIKLLLNLRNTL